jgi:hypothetical protein
MFSSRTILSSTQDYIDYLKKRADIMDSEVCTSAAQQIMEALGSTAATGREDLLSYLKNNLNNASPIQDGLYNLTVTWGEDYTSDSNSIISGANLWQHGLVLQKSSADLILYQAYVGKYALKDWLDSSSGGKVFSECWRNFSPMSPLFVYDQMRVWLGLLEQLKGFADKKDIASFLFTSKFLFGAEHTKVDEIKLQTTVKTGSKIKFDWKFSHLKPVKDLK